MTIWRRHCWFGFFKLCLYLSVLTVVCTITGIAALYLTGSQEKFANAVQAQVFQWKEEQLVSALKAANPKWNGIIENQSKIVQCGNNSYVFWTYEPLISLCQPYESHHYIGTTEFDDLSPFIDAQLMHLSVQSTKVAHLPALDKTHLKWLTIDQSNISDISQLAGMSLIDLDLSGTNVSDLSPIKGMPLSSLHLCQSKVADLSPLKGMPLDTLDISETEVSDISPLAGMPLRHLNISNTKVSDLSPLKGMPIRKSRVGGRIIIETLPIILTLNIGNTPAAKQPLPDWVSKDFAVDGCETGNVGTTQNK